MVPALRACVCVLRMCLKPNCKHSFFNSWKELMIWEEGAREDCGVILVTRMRAVCSPHSLRCVCFSVPWELNTHRLLTVPAAAQRSCKVFYTLTVLYITLAWELKWAQTGHSLCVCVFSHSFCIYIIQHFTPGNVCTSCGCLGASNL